MVSDKKHIERQQFIDYVSNPEDATSGFYLRDMDLGEALDLVPLLFNKKSLYVITEGGHHWYNLRGPNLQRLRNAIEEHAGPNERFNPDLTESDKDVLRTYQQSEIKFLWGRSYSNGNYKIKPCGGFFAYWHTLPLDLSRYGLFTKVPHYLDTLSEKKDYVKLKWILDRVAPKQKDIIVDFLKSNDKKVINGLVFDLALNDVVDILTERFSFDKAMAKRVRDLNYINSFRVCCLERALICWGLSRTKIETFYTLCPESHQNGIRYISRTKLKKITKALAINIKLKTPNGKWLEYIGKKGDPFYKLGQHENHFYAIEKTDVTTWAITHFDELDSRKRNWNFATAWRDKKKKQVKVYKKRAITSDTLFKLLLGEERRRLVPIVGSEVGFKESIHFNSVCRSNMQLTTLDYPKDSVRNPSFKEIAPDEEIPLLFWFDFEATTEGKYHQAYEVACVGEDDVMMYFAGDDPGALLLKELTKRVRDAQRKYNTTKIKCVLMAHYATYDFQFMVKHIICRRDSIFTRSSVKLIKGRYQWGETAAHSFKIWIKDTYVLIPMRLDKFASCFQLKNEDARPYLNDLGVLVEPSKALEKDVMPYGVMTQANLALDDVGVEEAKLCMEPKDFEQLIKNIDKLGFWATSGKALDGKKKRFKHKLYSKYYCKLDVKVLKAGYIKWKEMVEKQTTFNIDHHITLPQISYRDGHKRGVFDSVYEMSGIPREFHQRDVCGGKCMTRDNKKWHVKQELDDCDCCSQYPSAMRFMGGFLKGTPKVLTESILEVLNSSHERAMGRLERFDGYFLLIEITSIGVTLSFPLMSKVVDGIRQYRNELGSYYVNKFSLEDYVNFQDIRFRVIQGYYYDKGRNDKIAGYMQGLYDQRKMYKAEKNPIQKVQKEIMNSFYGRSIMKPILKQTMFAYGEGDLLKKMSWFHYCLNGFDVVSDESGKEIYTLEIEQSKGLHYSRPQVGAEVLSFSKRIMNQPMVLAEKLNIKIFYMDTDSMHIVKKDVGTLADAFREKYGKELLGDDLGQFNCDFDVKGAKDKPVSVESYFLGKKVYCDQLRYHDKDGNEKLALHIRMKGVPTPCVKQHAKGEGKSIMDLYDVLYEGAVVVFDLLNRSNIKPYFLKHRDFRHSTRGTFKRSLTFNLPKGAEGDNLTS